MSILTSFQSHGNLSFSIHAFIPNKNNAKKCMEGLLWESSGFQEYFVVIFSLCAAWRDHKEALNPFEFDEFYRNVAYCKSEGRYLKAFWSSEHRIPNLEFIVHLPGPDFCNLYMYDGKPLFLGMKKASQALKYGSDCEGFRSSIHRARLAGSTRAIICSWRRTAFEPSFQRT